MSLGQYAPPLIPPLDRFAVPPPQRCRPTKELRCVSVQPGRPPLAPGHVPPAGAAAGDDAGRDPAPGTGRPAAGRRRRYPSRHRPDPATPPVQPPLLTTNPEEQRQNGASISKAVGLTNKKKHHRVRAKGKGFVHFPSTFDLPLLAPRPPPPPGPGATISPVFDTCADVYAAEYLNLPEVQRAIHVRPGTVPRVPRPTDPPYEGRFPIRFRFFSVCAVLSRDSVGVVDRGRTSAGRAFPPQSQSPSVVTPRDPRSLRTPPLYWYTSPALKHEGGGGLTLGGITGNWTSLQVWVHYMCSLGQRLSLPPPPVPHTGSKWADCLQTGPLIPLPPTPRITRHPESGP